MVGHFQFPPWGSPFLDAGHTNTPSSSWHSERGLSPHMRELDHTVHNPTADQLAETLKVIMMTNGAREPLPAEYNSCIMQVLEGYSTHRLELQTKIKELEEAKKEKEETATELWQKTLEWKEEESRYKTELKKLEVILAKTPRGMELVAMARSQSVVRRNKKKAEVKKAADKGQVNKLDGEYVPRRLRPGFNILLPNYAEKKDAATTKSFMPHYRQNSLSMGFGSVSLPRPQLEEVEEPTKEKGKRSMLGKLTHAGKKSALRLFHGGHSPKKTSEESADKSPKKSPKKSSPKKKKNEDIAPHNYEDQMRISDFNLHQNAIHSTRSLWGHFGRSPNVNLASKDAEVARSAPTGPPKLKSPKKLKHKASLFDFEKSPRKLKHKVSAIDLEKSPRKLKNKASAIDIETAAAAARAATRRTAWLLPEDDESN
ncbi:hypothetical protein VE01_00948 [Pseudogymnoascus verrucosus]|uniref:Uncharacterized protein n=1 Tax=Pseudogymnoascus verrucosus TaxID=342668 RepID=A0A2P2SWL7_9PEZI|nr:uncharacterized protein VE01_00948 [Pseudogymnoascus verrucosus]OBU01247.1 hypothetical protein VE01_00948 [Pseudogymnoascus verrucosus]